VKHLKSPGVILGIIAVILAVAGTATAASLITGANVKDGSLTGADVKNGSLTSKDLSAATVKGLSGQDGTNGAKGDTGATGAEGDTGATGATGPKGDTGAAGADGTKGDTGAAGADGTNGAAGADGADGTNGAAGADGAKGDPGTNGVSNIILDGTPFLAAADRGADADTDPTLGSYKGGKLFRDLTLQPGKYDIEATMSVRGSGDAGVTEADYSRVRCNLVDETAGESLDTFYRTFFRPDEAAPAPGFREGLNLGALVTLAVPTTVEVRCGTVSGPGVGQIATAKLIATEAQSITTQP
jgi:hypothetical protein